MMFQAEWYAWKGFNSVFIENRLKYFELSKNYYPLEYTFRISGAVDISQLALNNNSMEFAKQALPVLNEALKRDLYSPELLAPAVVINYGMGDIEKAKFYFDLYKQTAKRSTYLDFMKGQL